MQQTLNKISENIEKLNNALQGAVNQGIELNKESNNKSLDFKSQRTDYFKKTFNDSLNNLIALNKQLKENNFLKINEIISLVDNINNNHKKLSNTELLQLTQKLKTLIPKQKKQKLNFDVPNLPKEISNEMIADIHEMNLCFESGLYRSATILCGRILETALHRKYYDVTGKDILETNPGVGLGKLIAKLKEKQVKFDPGITQQIHLINQVRISSVHKKQELFMPTKAQTQAMILYSMDVLGRMF